MIGCIRIHHLERCLLQPDEKKGGLCVMKELDFSGCVFWRGIYLNGGIKEGCMNNEKKDCNTFDSVGSRQYG